MQTIIRNLIIRRSIQTCFNANIYSKLKHAKSFRKFPINRICHSDFYVRTRKREVCDHYFQDEPGTPRRLRVAEIGK